MCTLSWSTSFLALVTAVSGFPRGIFNNQLHVRSAELAAMLVEIELKAVDHILAYLGKDARDLAK